MKVSGARKRASKQRILKAAITLFAQKGYAAVGVREIAQKADVNIAMISYYFDGKVGILKSIIERFFDEYFVAFKNIDCRDKSPEESVISIVRNMVNFVKKHRDLTMVMYNELGLDTPKMAKLKVEKLAQFIEGTRNLMAQFNVDISDRLHLSMIGPSLFSIVATHFRLRSLIPRSFGIKMNAAFYEEFIQTIATLFMYGVTGVSKRMHKKKAGRDEKTG